MSTRKIKDAKDISSGELIYFKGHAKATYLSDGRTVEQAIATTNNQTLSWGPGSDLNNFTTKGTYFIEGVKVDGDNLPILNNGGSISAKVVILSTNDSGNSNSVVTQILYLNNNSGGDGNVYTRTCQNSNWSDWGKLQTNIEVNAIGYGQDKSFDDLIDDGIYSGVNVYSDGYPLTGYETFVLIVLNGYLSGNGVSQLKYSIAGEESTVSTRNYSSSSGWSDWESLGGNGLSYRGYQEVNVESSTIDCTISPNKFYIWQDSVSSLTIRLGSDVAGFASEYLFQFCSASDSTTLTLPNSVKWANDEAPEIEANKVYQVSILKNLATYMKFSN